MAVLVFKMSTEMQPRKGIWNARSIWFSSEVLHNLVQGDKKVTWKELRGKKFFCFDLLGTGREGEEQVEISLKDHYRSPGCTCGFLESRLRRPLQSEAPFICAGLVLSRLEQRARILLRLECESKIKKKKNLR